ncbi:MAG TPA: T9SS type A sorting domain-containing protein [Puia sp.]|jgi:hypothetical protein
MKRPLHAAAYFILLITCLVFNQTTYAQISYTWNGSLSTDWNTPGNWTPSGIPTATDNVTIVTGGNTCLLNASAGITNFKLTSGTLDLAGFTLTVNGSTATFTAGTVQNGTMAIPNATATSFGNGPVNMNCIVAISSAAITIKNTSFQKALTITKTGASNDASAGGNIFNGVTTMINAGAGYLLMGNGSPDQFNAAATFNNTGGSQIYVAYSSTNNIFGGVTTFNNTPSANTGIYVSQNSAGTLFNDNIVVSSNNGQGVIFGGNATATCTLAATKTITIGAGGFSAGTLNLKEFTQTGATAQSLTLSGGGNLTLGPSSSFDGNVTISSPTLFLNGCLFNGTTDITKTGSTGDYSSGGNTFTGVSKITNSGSSYFLLGNSNPDIWNNDVTFTDNGSERLLPCWASAGNQFNGNIYVNTAGSAQGIQFCGGNTTATATLAATKTIQAGSTGLTAGYLYLKQFTQLGSSPINLTGTGNTVLYLGPGSSFGGSFTASAPDIWAQGATYNSPAAFSKTGGSSNHNNQYQNIFNSTCTIDQQSNSGYFMLGYNSNDLFNDNIIITSSGSGGIHLGWTSGTGTPTLAAGKTILVGSSGFSAGFLYLNTFTQLGNATMNLNFTGTNTNLVFARGSVIGGDLTSNTPDIYFNGSLFNGQVNATKTGSGTDYSAGGNTFQGAAIFTNTGSGSLILGNGNSDTLNSDVTFNSNSSGTAYIGAGWGSAGNIFNGNITVSSTGTAGGIYFCQNTGAAAVLAAGKAIQVGSGGFSSGILSLKQLTQLGNAATNLTLTGATTLLQVGPSSSFGGDFIATSPRILLNGSVFSGVTSFTKTGATGEWSFGGNTFNSTLTVNHLGGGYFGFANGAPDIYNGDVYVNNNSTERIIFGNNPTGNQFNGNIILTQIGSSVGTAFGWSSTTDVTLAAGKTISIGAAGFSTGYLQLQRFTQLGNVPVSLLLTGNSSLTFGPTSAIGGDLTSTSGSLYFSGCTFNGQVNATKTGATNDYGSGGNIFNGSTIFNNTGTGNLNLGNGAPDTWNSDVSFNSSGSAYIAAGWNAAGNAFNGNINLSSTGSSTGIYFCPNTASTATLAAGYGIQVSSGSFSTGTLSLRQFTQLGNIANNLTLTGANTLLQVGPSSAFGGDFTAVSPRILLNGSVFSGVTSFTKTGATGEWSYGGNTFNSALTINHLGAGYFGFANGAPDIYNGDVYVNNNSTERIIFGNNPVGNQFNGNIILTQTGSSQGIAFGWSSTTDETMAAGKTISIGAAGFNTGFLQIERFTQLGNAPMNLPLTGNSSLTFGPTSAIGGDLTSTSGSLFFNGCTFNGLVNSTKTGASNDGSAGNNIFNGNAVMTNAGSGYLLFGNGNKDQFNAASTFNNTGSNNIYVAYNSANNLFGGVTTFNNSPTGNGLIYVSNYSAGTAFNDNVVVTSTSGQGVQFCNSNATATATLTSGKTISIGAGGFSAGTLLLRQFTQTGSTAQSLTLTGTGSLVFGPSSSFGGNLTSVSPTLFYNGCIFNGTVTASKNGATSDGSNGNNIFYGSFVVTNTGAGYFMMGNGSPDLWQSTATFNNQSPANHMYIAYNSTGNTFNGDVTFNNQPGAVGLWIYPNTYGVNTQYNGNISVTNISGGGVYFGNGSGTAVLANGKTIGAGASGFNSGGLIFRSFIQSGAGAAQNILTTGTSYIQYGNSATFNAALTSSSPGLFFNNSTFNGTVNCTKTGTTNDQSQGNNIFNGAATFINNGTGYLMMTANTADAYNNDVSFVQNNTGIVYPNYNNNSTYTGSVTVTSPSATAITFGSGNGTATLSGSAVQYMNATGSTATPVFTRLVIANTGGGVTLNTTSINVSKNLTLNSGLLNTTTSRILTMLNGSTTASGDALSTSYVNGPMRYQKQSSGASTLNFPIGNSPDCRPVVLTVSHSSGSLYTYQAQLFNASAEALGYTLPPSVDNVSHIHYYTIGRTDASGVNQPVSGLSGNQTIQIYFGANDYVSNGGTLTIVKNTYVAPTAWIDIGGAGGPIYNAGANLTGSLTSTSAPTAFNSFSTFALADRIGGGNVLPVGLLYFNARPDKGGVGLTWATTTESNNNYFSVERSKDGTNFEFVEKVATKALNGNSDMQLNYTGYDASPYNGLSYYRLKQTDLDGQDKYSEIQPVNFDQSNGNVSVYPNPTRGQVFVKGITSNQNTVKIEWYDAGGKLLTQESAPVSGGFAILNPHFNNGIYLLKIITAEGRFIFQQVIIMK